MENYFFFVLNRTKDFAKRINCSCHKKHAQMTTLRSFAHNLANQKNLIFLLGQISLSALSTRDLGTKLSLTALFAVDVTDLVVN